MTTAAPQHQFSVTVDIPSPSSLVWTVMTDVERWPEWTASVTRVKRLTDGLFQKGSRVRIHQPGFPPAFWRVTDFHPGAGFIWVSVAPGLHVTARHEVEATAAGSRVNLSLRYDGWLGRLLARWTRSVTERYLDMEAQGLKARCTGPHVAPSHLPCAQID